MFFSIMIYHRILLISGQLSCLLVLTAVNSDAMNIWVHVSF